MTDETLADKNMPERPENAGELEALGFDGLLTVLRNGEKPDERRYAAYLLRKKAQNPLAIPSLIEALSDVDKSVREQATFTLSAIGKAAVEPLTEAMKDPKWETRYRAAEALGRIADEKAIKPLIQGLKDNRDHVRYMAAKGLKDLGDSDSIEPLIILLKDENTYVRMMSVRALGALGGKRSTDALNAALAAETDEKIRAAIVEALK